MTAARKMERTNHCLPSPRPRQLIGWFPCVGTRTASWRSSLFPIFNIPLSFMSLTQVFFSSASTSIFLYLYPLSASLLLPLQPSHFLVCVFSLGGGVGADHVVFLAPAEGQVM